MNKKLVLLLMIWFLIGILFAVNFKLDNWSETFNKVCTKEYDNQSACGCLSSKNTYASPFDATYKDINLSNLKLEFVDP